MAQLIDRIPRGTPDYEAKIAALREEQRATLELVEESVLADRGRTHARRTRLDGTTLDMTAYDEFDVLVTFRVEPGRGLLSIDFMFYDSLSS
jgi:hypothetical protein